MKKILTVLLAAAILFALCACGGTNESSKDPNASGATTTPSAQSTPKPAGTSAPDQGESTTALPAATTPDNEPDPGPTFDLYDLHIPYGNAVADGVREGAWDNAAKVPINQIKKDNPSPDVEAYASVLWDENGLYFLFEITDPEIAQNGTVGDYNIDGIYLYISENIETTATAFADFSDGVYQFALINPAMELLPRYGDGSEVHNAISAYTLNDTGMIIEFSYTPDYAVLEAGTELLIDYQYNDAGASGSRYGALGWYNGSDENANPFHWGMATLLAQGVVSPEKP